MGVPSGGAEPLAQGVGVKCGGGGGVKVGGNLLPAVYFVRDVVWSSGEFNMASVQVSTDGANC